MAKGAWGWFPHRPFKNKTLTKKHTSKGSSRSAEQALKGLRLGCLNVRGCNNLDKRERIERLLDERKLDALALSERGLSIPEAKECVKDRRE